VIAGCSGDNPVDTRDGAFSLVVDPEINASPEHFTPGSQVSLTLTYEMRYRGSGIVSVIGHGGGNPVGILGDPYDTEIGFYSFPITFMAGQHEIPFMMEMTAVVQLPMLSFQISCDSLWTSEGMVGWETPEGHKIYREDIPPDTAFLVNNVGVSVTIPRETE
jgi:hypothetical protein